MDIKKHLEKESMPMDIDEKINKWYDNMLENTIVNTSYFENLKDMYLLEILNKNPELLKINQNKNRTNTPVNTEQQLQNVNEKLKILKIEK